jgi:hypothetical protein
MEEKKNYILLCNGITYDLHTHIYNYLISIDLPMLSTRIYIKALYYVNFYRIYKFMLL